MKSTGIVRRTDDLGRVAIPMEIRQCMKKSALYSRSLIQSKEIYKTDNRPHEDRQLFLSFFLAALSAYICLSASWSIFSISKAAVSFSAKNPMLEPI